MDLAPATLRTSHCLAHEVTLCAVPAEGANTCLAPAWSCCHPAGRRRGEQHPSEPAPDHRPRFPSRPRAGEQRHRVLLSVAERISARLTSHSPLCLPEPTQGILCPSKNQVWGQGLSPGQSHCSVTTGSSIFGTSCLSLTMHNPVDTLGDGRKYPVTY